MSEERVTTARLAPVIISELLAGHGISDVVVSPGTRNAPLVVAAARCGKLRLHSVVDERSAAFVALGMSLRTARPVALICTSGTAMLNYAPAVAEAYYRGVPLIVITADRPERWIDQDDSQTIRQPGALSNIVVDSFDIPSDENIVDFAWLVNRTVNDAILSATGRVKGPVHLNVHLDAPLGDTASLPTDETLFRVVKRLSPVPVLSREQVNMLSEKHVNSRILVVVGTGNPDVRLNRALQKLATNPNVIIFQEAQSNIRGLGNSVRAIDATLHTLTDNEKILYSPQLLITVGGSVVSPSLKEWLRNIPGDVEHWYLKTSAETGLVDCFMHLSMVLDVDAPSFISSFAGVLRRKGIVDTGYAEFWADKARVASNKISAYCNISDWCDLTAIQAIFEAIPPNTNVQVSNGMSIRYAQLSDYTRVHRVDCNRGCSGIDGSTSTAVGASINCDRPTVLITGDTSARYDLGGLAIGSMAGLFTIFVLNNAGGDIFRIIKPTRNLPECEPYLSVGTDMDFKRIACAFGYEYSVVTNKNELSDICKKVSSPAGKPRFVEIITKECDNAGTYRRLFKYLKSN